MSNKQAISTFLVAGLAGTLFVSGAAHGEFTGISLVSKPDPQNPRLLICNLLLNFDDPADRALAVNGCIPSLGDPQLFFSTNSSNGFHQELFMGGNRDFAVTAAELVTVPAMANDTYVNIGIKSGETTAGGIGSGTATDLSPTTPRAITLRHLLRILGEYFEYYHRSRPHQSLDGNSPNRRNVESSDGRRVAGTAVLGGLHHTYRRAA